MFLLVPAHPGFPGQIPQSRKTVVCVCVLTEAHLLTFLLQLVSSEEEMMIRQMGRF